MFRKIVLISLFIFALIFVVRFGSLSQAVAKTQGQHDNVDISKLPEPEIIAEYKYDSRIQAAAFYDNAIPKVVATEKEVIIYDRAGKIIRKKPLKLYEQVKISENGEYLAYIEGSGLMGTRDKMVYEDIKGNKLFVRWLEAQWPNPAPLGDYLVFTPIGYHDLIEFVGMDGKTIAKYHIGISGDTIRFSKDGRKCFIVASASLGLITNVICFGEKGEHLLFKKIINIKGNSFDISDNGMFWVVGGIAKENEWKDKKGQLHWGQSTAGFYLFREGKIMFNKEKDGSIVALSPDGRVIAASELTFHHDILPKWAISIYLENGDILKRIPTDELQMTGMDYLNIDDRKKVVGIYSTMKGERNVVIDSETGSFKINNWNDLFEWETGNEVRLNEGRAIVIHHREHHNETSEIMVIRL